MVISGVDLIALAFGAFNVLRLASYFPQIAADLSPENSSKIG